MEDSPRSSKRRKLDTPSRTASSPAVKNTPRKSSSRLSGRQAQLTHDDTLDAEESTGTSQRRSSGKLGIVSNGTDDGRSRGRGLTAEEDVYDDIEGALPRQVASPAPSATRGKKPAARQKRKIVFDPSMPHPFKSSQEGANPSLSAKKDGESASRKPRSVVNGTRRGQEQDIQDELAEEASTPTGRTRNTRSRAGAVGTADEGAGAASSRRPSVRASRRAPAAEEDDASVDQLQINGIDGASPSKLRSAGRAAKSAKAQKKVIETEGPAHVTPSRTSKRRAPIPDSEDELRDRDPPSRATSARGRRRANRTDHVNNRGETDIASEEDDAPHINGVDGDEIDGNSAIGSVLDPTEPSPFNKPSPLTSKPNATALLHKDLPSGREAELLKSIVMERIMAKRPVPVVGLDEEYKSVHQLVEHTITAGEGNSMLIIGSRGSGKTSLVNKVLSEVSKDNAETYHVVRLNGFVHTDDKIALREIWRQLGKEMDIEEDGGLSKNYADTLTTLLALLSHPSEHTGELTDQVAKAVIFIMDEFDLFAMHPRQTLLYNLFDIAQSRKAPIAVLGLTTRIDVANSLEKRVKSRFSHRYVHLSLAKTFTAFQELCKASLVIQPDQLSIEERALLCAAPKTTPAKRKKASPTTQPSVLATWNSNIAALFATPSFLTTHLAPHFYLTKSVPLALTTFLLPTATLSTTPLFPTPQTSLCPPDSKLALLPHLSTLALALLIAAARLDIIHDSDSCNFNMAFDEYVTLASKARIQSAAGGGSASGAVGKVWGKEVARREWEGLVELGLVVPVVGGGASVGGFGMVRCDVSLEEIGGVVAGEKGIERGLERWCRQL